MALAAAAWLASAPAAAAQSTPIFVCHFNSGPKAGTEMRLTTGVAGAACADGAGSRGTVISRRLSVPHAGAVGGAFGGALARSRPSVIYREGAVGGGAAGGSPPVATIAPSAPTTAERAETASTAAPSAPATAAPAPRPRPPRLDGAPPDNEAIATRLFVPPDYALPKGYGAVAVLVFIEPPQDELTRLRYIQVCESYMSVLPDADAVYRERPQLAQMVTLWPREDIAAPLSFKLKSFSQLGPACAAAVENYAYLAAGGWLAKLPRQARFGADRRGPFLIAWAPPSAVGRANVPILTFDLSDFEQSGTIRTAFRWWRQEIEENPSLWENGWDLTRWKLNTQAMADNYATRILAAVKLVPFIND